jgi:hypothetical protein
LLVKTSDDAELNDEASTCQAITPPPTLLFEWKA